jgi:hypothetical protein
MIMLRYAGTCRLSQVHTDVYSIRGVLAAYRGLTPYYQFHHFRGRGGVGVCDEIDVFERDDHQMAGCVRIDIENNEIVLAAVEDEVLFVGASVR